MENSTTPLSRRKSMIFVNLPVQDLKRSMDFFSKIGFDFNPMFTDEKAACLMLGENLFAMLLVDPFFQGFTKLPVTDTSKSVEVINALSAESPAEVDRIVDLALAAGGTVAYLVEDMPGTHSRNFMDPDGHIWEFMHMDLEAAGRV